MGFFLRAYQSDIELARVFRFSYGSIFEI